MSNNAPITNDIVERTKEILHAGNIRHVIIKTPDGRTLLDTSLTIATGLSIALIFFIPGGLFIAIIAAILAVYTRLKIEIVREVGDSDEVITLDIDEHPSGQDEEVAERLRSKTKS